MAELQHTVETQAHGPVFCFVRALHSRARLHKAMTLLSDCYMGGRTHKPLVGAPASKW